MTHHQLRAPSRDDVSVDPVRVQIGAEAGEAQPYLLTGFPGGPEAIHWSVPDPAAVGTGRAGYAAFRAVAGDLHSRIAFLTQAIAPPPRSARGDVS